MGRMSLEELCPGLLWSLDRPRVDGGLSGTVAACGDRDSKGHRPALQSLPAWDLQLCTSENHPSV